jgi:PTH1 family peptidyl-tRNA hydrolase
MRKEGKLFISFCVTNETPSCIIGNRGEEKMFIIAGLGNPTLQYEGTRHNVGFEVIDALANKYNISVNVRKNRAYIGKGMVNGRNIILAKPQTYMNLSGESIRGLADYYKIEPEDELLVIYDDVSLDVGQLRVRKKGSAGGHNGIKNIISNLGTEIFPRIKVGVGEKPRNYELADYVLGHFSKAERELMEEGYKRAICAVETILEKGIEPAMNTFNRKVKTVKAEEEVL